MNPQALTLAILKGIAYTENGGKVDLKNVKAGQSGELKSVFQFEPATWKRDAKMVTGDENLSLTPANEALVAHGVIYPQVKKALEQGKDPDTIAREQGSAWNSGKTEGYKENLKGVNKEGVKYDVPKYADKVANYAKKFIGEIISGQEVADTHATNTDSGHATAVANKFLKSVQDVQPEIAESKPNIAIAAEAPLPQNNNINLGLLQKNTQVPGSIPGMLG